jgi:hypothetical protein
MESENIGEKKISERDVMRMEGRCKGKLKNGKVRKEGAIMSNGRGMYGTSSKGRQIEWLM